MSAKQQKLLSLRKMSGVVKANQSFLKMQIVYLGLLFSLTLARPTFQPQDEKMKQDFVEEQREENIQNKIAAIHRFGKRKTQGLAPNENTGQDRKIALSDFRTNRNKQGSKPQNPFESQLTTNEDFHISTEVNSHSDPKLSINPESTAIRKLHDLEASNAALIQSNPQQTIRPVILRELLEEEIEANKPSNTLGKIPLYMNDAKVPSNNNKSHQRNSQIPNSLVKTKITYHVPPNTDYLKQLPQIKNIPSDFQGSGHPDFQDEEDHLSPFSGDGPPFKGILNKEEAIVSGPVDDNTQTEFFDPSKAQTNNPDSKGPSYNELPEKEENGRNTTGIKAGKEANVTGVRLAEGTNDIIGITNFKELPGKEGQRVDASSQNAHQGQVKFHYPDTFSSDKRKEGSRNVPEATKYNEIPKHGKESHTKDTAYSGKSQAISSEKQERSSKGKSRDPLIPSPGIDNEIVSQNDRRIEGTIMTYSKKHHDVHDRQKNTAWNKVMLQRKGHWGYRKRYSKRFSSPRPDSSESSSDSDSSSESEGD